MLYDPRAFVTHAALLRQAFAHCARFPTAASRRSLGRVSVPVWLIILSDQLPISGLVGRYPANYLMGREPIPGRPKALAARQSASWSDRVLATLSSGYPRPWGTGLTCYSPVRRSTQGPKPPFSLDLHVLSTPPTFALSQDQTLQFESRRLRAEGHLRLIRIEQRHVAPRASRKRAKLYLLFVETMRRPCGPTLFWRHRDRLACLVVVLVLCTAAWLSPIPHVGAGREPDRPLSCHSTLSAMRSQV